ncbi:MAG: hypothetical protein J1E03_00840 [Acetatifactor sp.]|nr:hypothetical protein [Acetatifactor sp.]
MSAKTKIIVLHMKELIYTGVFVVLGILFVILLVVMFLPDKEESPAPEQNKTQTDVTNTDSLYIPGIYTTELVLGSQAIDVEVIVDNDAITSIRMVNLNDAVTTMYPLLEPTFDSICQQVYELQSLEQVTYTADAKYTSLVLLEAIQTSLNKATPSPSPSASPAVR